jgi:PucR family transcriptional regulator, purine catabolism regulatory protein
MSLTERALTLQDVLAAPAVVSTNPEVVTGSEQLRRRVRWMHSTEIREIAPLLRGGEVLLTAGLGLAGASTQELRAYVDDLADRGVAALFLELGRTFSAPPPALLEAAHERSFPVVVLHNVVPFVDITEAVHRLLLRTEVEYAREAQEIDEHLHEALLLGSGLAEILRRVGALGHARVQLKDASGRVFARSPGRINRPDQPTVIADVTVLGQPWGRLELHGPRSPRLSVLAERAAIAVGISLAHSRSWESAHPHAQRELLRDMLDMRFRTPGEARTRLAALGIDLSVAAYAGVAVGIPPVVPLQAGLAALAHGLETLGTHSIVGEYGRELVAVVRIERSDDEACRAVARRLLALIDRQVAAFEGGRVIALAIGRAAQDPDDAAHSLRRALEAQRLVSRLNLRHRAILAADTGVYGLLARLADDPDLERFVTEQLGRLLDHDATHSSALLPTLEQYIASHESKSATGAALGVRRQTIYRRLEQIERLVGGPISDPDRLAAVNLALKARAIRNAGPMQAETLRAD